MFLLIWCPGNTALIGMGIRQKKQQCVANKKQMWLMYKTHCVLPMKHISKD